MPSKPLLLLNITLNDFAGREVVATISSNKPPQFVLTLGMRQVRLPTREADKLAAWWQAWMAQRR